MSINKLRPLPPFKLQVLTNFPFIDADFDALTNWELYAKLVEYLNKVIVPSENELISAFNDLKDYVDNFLDTLNIQEEVNNKLDEMALDGTLENLLTPIVNGILTDEKLASIVYDIWGEDWNNLATKSYVDEKVAKYGIMPTASLDYLGKIVQYIGVSDSTYTRGYFYECVSDGASTPTYSWSKISFSSNETSELLFNTSMDNLFEATTIQNGDIISAMIELNSTCLNANKDVIMNAYNEMVDNNILYKEFNIHVYDNINVDVFYNTKIVIDRTQSPTAQFLNVKYDYEEFNGLSILSNVVSDYPQKEFQISRTWWGDDLSEPVYDSEGHLISLPDITTNTGTIMIVPNLSMDTKIEYPISNNYTPAHKKYVDDNVAKYTIMPTASVDYLGKVVQFIGTTDATYTKGHFYECVSDGGGTPTYSWSEISFSGINITKYTYEMPNTEYLDIINNTRSTDFDTNLETILNDMYNSNIYSGILIVRSDSGENLKRLFTIEVNTSYNFVDIALIKDTHNSVRYSSFKYDSANDILKRNIYVSYLLSVNNNVVTLGTYGMNTQNYGFIEAYLTMPTASENFNKKVVQFIGTTDSTYTKGHFYECVSDGGTPATYSWSEISFGGGSVSFPQGVYFMENDYLYLNRTYNNISTNFKSNLINVLNDMITNNINTSIVLFRNTSDSPGIPHLNLVTIISNTVYIFPIITSDTIMFNTGNYSYNQVSYTITYTGNTITDLTNIYYSNDRNNIITTTNFTNQIKGYTGYNSSKTQTLKNVNGILTWIDDV